jgi:hypothetical protein
VFSQQVTHWLQTWMSGVHPAEYQAPIFMMHALKQEVSAFVRGVFLPAAIDSKGKAAGVAGTFSGKRWPSGKRRTSFSFAPDFVLLASGMGVESTTLPGEDEVSGPSFWSDESLGSEDESLAVFGAGDGALQDVLRALTKFDHPLQLLEHLRRAPKVSRRLDEVERQLTAVEAQHRLSLSWTVDRRVCEYVDAKCVAAARDLLPQVAASVGSALRSGNGKVWLISQGNHITKAYMLNRFVFHLVRLYILRSRKTPHRPFEWKHTTRVDRAQLRDGHIEVDLNTASDPLLVDHVAVRWGQSMNDEDAPAGFQLVGITEKKKAKRTTLAQVPLPFVVA